MAQLPGAHYRDTGDGGQEKITSSALSRILLSPNSYQTRSDFILNLVSELLFQGNAYAWAERSNRSEVTALHLMPAMGTQVLIEPKTRAVFYGLAENPLAGQLDYAIPQRDVMHVRMRSRPGYPLQGITPLRWAALAQATNTAISASQAAFFAQASQPSGFLSSDQPLSGDQMTMLREAWQNRTAGVAAGQVPILGGGLKFQNLTMTSQDAQLIQAFSMTVADIARAYGVPLPIIGDLEHATLKNIEQLIDFWLSTGLGFMVEHIELAFDKFFGLPPGQFTEFDTDILLRTAFLERIDGLTKAISGGLYSPNEARAKEGLPAADGGEEPRVQAQVVPLSQINAEPLPSLPTAPVPPSAPALPAGEPAVPQLPEPAAKAIEEQLARLADLARADDARRIEIETRAADARNCERIELLAHLGDLEELVGRSAATMAEHTAERIVPLEAALAALAQSTGELRAMVEAPDPLGPALAAQEERLQAAMAAGLARIDEAAIARTAPLESALAALAALADRVEDRAPLVEALDAQHAGLQAAIAEGVARIDEAAAERIAPLESAVVELARRTEQLRTMVEASDPALDPDEALELTLLQLRKAKREAKHAP
jgi:HK97 family phage portal protein